MRFSVVRPDGERPAVTCFGFREPALVPEGDAQVVMRFSVIRLDGERPGGNWLQLQITGPGPGG